MFSARGFFLMAVMVTLAVRLDSVSAQTLVNPEPTEGIPRSVPQTGLCYPKCRCTGPRLSHLNGCLLPKFRKVGGGSNYFLRATDYDENGRGFLWWGNQLDSISDGDLARSQADCATRGGLTTSEALVNCITIGAGAVFLQIDDDCTG
jgi:hypothetical protein